MQRRMVLGPGPRRRHQGLLPDRLAFDTALRADIGGDLKVEMKRIGQMKVIWEPAQGRSTNTPIRVEPIESLLLTKRSDALGIDRRDKAAVRNFQKELRQIDINFESFVRDRSVLDMRNVSVYDIETCSSADAPGIFMTYAAGCRALGVANGGFDGERTSRIIFCF